MESIMNRLSNYYQLQRMNPAVQDPHNGLQHNSTFDDFQGPNKQIPIMSVKYLFMSIICLMVNKL